MAKSRTRPAAGRTQKRTASLGTADRTVPTPPAAATAAPLPAIDAFPVETVIAAQRDQFVALSEAGKALMAGMSEINREMIDFGERRAEAILESAEAIPGPTGWNDLFSAQVDYAGAAAQAYLAETAKLCDLGMRVSQANWMPLLRTMEETFGNAFRTDD